MERNIDQLLDDYTKWLRKQYIIDEAETYTEIDTPFLNNINDNIRFFLTEKSKNEIVLDDDGETISDLEMIGIDLSKGQRKVELESILQQYKISNPDDRLMISGTIEDFPQMKQNLITAILKIDEFSMLKKKNVSNMFYDDIYEYFDENDFGGLPDHLLMGRDTGIEYKFNYVIPGLKKKGRPERIVDFKNNLNFSNVTTSIYQFNDVNSGKDNKSENIIIYNDEETKLNNKVQKAAENSNIFLFPFSDKKQLELLKNDNAL